IRASIEVKEITNKGGYHLHCRQKQTNKEFSYEADRVVLATGYKPHVPKWMDRFHHEIEWEDDKRFKVMKDYRLQFKTPRD
ncbi:SidA/IucD/PvdA family monooxygenase, partial [Escherichia coli]|uniref:SidA/IucD/PvdA family monooxygenase n=2 Tax=Bacteria TaxID=2 RepID=UPI00321AA9EE